MADLKTFNNIPSDRIKSAMGVPVDRTKDILGSKVNLLPLANNDIVNWNSLDAIDTIGAANLTASSAGTSYFSLYKATRLNGPASISQIELYIKNVLNINRFDIVFWRTNGSNYDEIGRENIVSKLSEGSITVYLSNEIILLEGDFIGIYIYPVNQVVPICLLTIQLGGMKYASAVNYSGNNVNWTGTTINYKHILLLKSKAPLFVGIGDSIMESYPLHTSMIDVTRTTVNISKSWMYKLKALDSRFTYQNCGIGNEETTQIEARFNRDVVLKKPKFAIMNGGVNDIAHAPANAKSTFLAKWASMLDMCVSNNIIPVVWKIMPWTNGTNAQLQTRDDWNASLITLINTYANHSKWVIIDFDADLGQNRVGGDAGNLWNVKSAYNQDGIHYNETGQAKIAEVVLREIGKKYKL